MDDNKIGMNIKKYRKGKFTQQELADKIGKTESSIRKYEKGLVTIHLDEVEKEIHETTSFKDYLSILGYEIHESPYNDKWIISIKESNTQLYISNEEKDTLERTTKENIDLRITKYISDGKHNQ